MDRVLAIAGLRFRLFVRGVRGAAGVARLAGAMLVLLTGVVIALGIAAGFAALTHAALASGEQQAIRLSLLVVFHSFLFFGVVLPLVRGAMAPGFDAAPFRIFPIGRARLYAITLGSSAFSAQHLFYYPAFAAVCVTCVLLPGQQVGTGLATMLLAWLFYVGWGNTIVLFLVSLMRRRRTREMLIFGMLFLLVVASLAPSVLIESSDGPVDFRRNPYLAVALDVAVAVGAMLPPTLVAETLTSLRVADSVTAPASLLGLALWDAAGLALGYHVFTRYYLGERQRGRGGAPRKRAARNRSRPLRQLLDTPLLSFVPQDVRAVASKELRYLLRSVAGKLALFVTPTFVLVMLFAFRDKIEGAVVLGFDVETLAFYSMALYVALFSSNFVNNAFAWEGDGLQAYYLSPVPLRRVFAGKNLGLWIYIGLLLLTSVACWSLLVGLPDLPTLLTAAVVCSVPLVAFTAAGNVISLWFPVRRDIAAMSNSPSQIAVVLSLVSLGVASMVISLFVVLPRLLGVGFLLPLFLLALLAMTVWGYAAVLRLAGDLMEERKEKLIESLQVD